MVSKRIRPWIASLTIATATACGDSTGMQMAGNVAVSVATQSPRVMPTPAAARTTALDDTIASGADTIIVTRAQIVLREIELRPLEVPNCDANQGSNDCEEVELGPVLVDLPLQSGAERQFEVALPVGTYEELELDVHKPDDSDPQDQMFIQQHPEFANISILVGGTFNGAAFVFQSDLNVKQELALVPPLTVAQSTMTNVTVFVDLDTWFRANDGTVVDPETANKGGPNENLVRDNIIASFRAFEDQDRDGDDRDG